MQIRFNSLNTRRGSSPRPAFLYIKPKVFHKAYQHISLDTFIFGDGVQTFNYIDIMPRKARISVPGTLHHVMSRGIEGRDIFAHDDDRALFLELLSDGIHRTGFKCYAWSLMPNHYHLLLRTSDLHLAELMRPLNGKYARYFRARQRQSGYLFQDRYRSIATQDQNYVEEIVRYIHLNPLRAKICADLSALDAYPWTGHCALIGTRTNKFQETDSVLRRFGADTAQARERYRAYLEEGLRTGAPENAIEAVRRSNKGLMSSGQCGCWVIGDREFVEKALHTDRENRLRLALYAREGWNLERLQRTIAIKTGIEESALRTRYGNSKIRKAFAWIAYRKLEFPAVEIARYLNVRAPAVSMMVKNGEQYAQKLGLDILKV